MRLVRPTEHHLPSYIAALERGWSADNLRPEAAQQELVRIRAGAQAFIAGMEDREAKGPPVTLPDGSIVNRLPGFRRWLWEGEFCGSIGLRWQEGTTELPAHCLGHIGYAVVPWRQGLGYAKAALAQLLPEARSIGLPFVEITTDPENVASQRVILANGGVLVERFIKPPQFGSKPGLRFRIAVA
jgi:predicted acetyltransferase